MIQIYRLSNYLYACMVKEVGSSTQVRIRRDVADIKDMIRAPIDDIHKLESGSHREGFRLETSDIDMMYWSPDLKVICDLSQICFYRLPQDAVFLMECNGLPPGFARLKLLTKSSDDIPILSDISIIVNNEIYISSLLFREEGVNHMKTCHASSKRHGPCATMFLKGKDFDFVLCLRSNHWPVLALPWIDRCRQTKWPAGRILSAIIKEGCHVVPISSSPLNFESDITDWRISFSGAEIKLVYSMNHCQFLCYGLLKIFLKEVINSGKSNPLLCSYFMKTAMFWVIQNDRTLQWMPCNLLACFWRCFKLLVSWVYKEECPNFFIPQNNMFRGKIIDQALFDQLYDLYCKGIACLLLSPTIGRYLRIPILYPRLKHRNLIENSWSKDSCFIAEINSACEFVENEEGFVQQIDFLELLLQTGLSSFQAEFIERCITLIFINCSMRVLNQMNWSTLSNKSLTYVLNKPMKMMQLACKRGLASDILYLAIFNYKVCRFEESLRCLQKAQTRMTLPFVLFITYPGYVGGGEEEYIRATAGMPLSERIRKAVIHDVHLNSKYIEIDELLAEQNANREDADGCLYINPYVMLHMLYILNHYRLGRNNMLERNIQDLYSLVVSEHKSLLKDMSWQILGICQQICGDFEGALNSFQCSLQQLPTNGIQKATMFRIQTISDNHLR